MKLSS